MKLIKSSKWRYLFINSRLSENTDLEVTNLKWETYRFPVNKTVTPQRLYIKYWYKTHTSFNSSDQKWRTLHRDVILNMDTPLLLHLKFNCSKKTFRLSSIIFQATSNDASHDLVLSICIWNRPILKMKHQDSIHSSTCTIRFPQDIQQLYNKIQSRQHNKNYNNIPN